MNARNVMSPYFVVRVIRDWKNKQQISTIAPIILYFLCWHFPTFIVTVMIGQYTMELWVSNQSVNCFLNLTIN